MPLHPGKELPVLQDNVTRHHIVDHESQDGAGGRLPIPELRRKFVGSLEQSGVAQAMRPYRREPNLLKHLLFVLEMMRNADQ